ncbi:GNAT family N-acetyltransferase [Zavarzinia sp. CC-PAN008]|uniref:GNAT family N-acetyltransferase n=1 Tax=Zavarzinia sp. CC-PAN008 TaxID=3243332 RepID=UPI003F748C99
MSALVIRVVSATAPEAAALMAALDQDLQRRYPGQPINGITPATFEADGGLFAIGEIDGQPAVSGGFQPFEGAAEIKRMFVAPGHRGKGYGRAMLDFLEAEAFKRGHRRGVLETGGQQQEALGLYQSAGWRRIPAFGPYKDDPRSNCFEKALEG